jgi:hypothetical protein
VTRQEAIEIAQHFAKLEQPGYYTEPFQPHEWVLQAMLAAYDLGYDDCCYAQHTQPTDGQAEVSVPPSETR